MCKARAIIILMFMLSNFVLGLCLGSFVGALVWRVKNKKNWVSGRSQCEHCKHLLGPFDLIPVISWLTLKGRCRYCHHKIGAEPIVIELLTGLLFAASYVFWPYSFSGMHTTLFALWIAILIGYIALALYDFKYMELPNGLVIFTSIVSVIWVAVYSMGGNSVIPNILGGIALAGFFYLLWIVSSGKWIGGGDVKLSFALGLLAGGIPNVLLLLLFASLLGTLYGLPLLLNTKGKKKQHIIPFGPFLIISTIIVFFFGNSILALLSLK